MSKFGATAVVREKPCMPDDASLEVAHWPIAKLLDSKESALANAVRRVAEQAGQVVHAAHGSSPTPL
jgi:hypothetical protein